MISAMEEQEVGWPELLAWVILTEWILSLWARSWSSVSWFSADIILTAIGKWEYLKCIVTIMYNDIFGWGVYKGNLLNSVCGHCDVGERREWINTMWQSTIFAIACLQQHSHHHGYTRMKLIFWWTDLKFEQTWPITDPIAAQQPTSEYLNWPMTGAVT